MSDIKPEWVEAVALALHRDRWGRKAEIAVAAVAPLIRADERERAEYAGPCWDGCIHNDAHLAAMEARDHELTHAEAVAARLVEVIVEMQSDLDHAWAVANGEARR